MNFAKPLSSAALRPWLPDVVLATAAGGPHLPAAPDARECNGAALFADIAGYTRLTRDLARQGPAGAELAGDVLNACFSLAVAEVAAHHGDVIGFAGDAVIALWHGDNAVALAKASGDAIQSRAPLIATALQGRPVRMRIGVGAGRTWLMRLGGHRGEWIFMAAGEPFSQMGPAARRAPVGGVVLSAPARARLATAVPGPHLPRLIDDRPLDVEVMRAFLPQVLLERLAAGHSDWLAELRTVAIVFCTVPDMDLGEVYQREQFHTFVAQAQRTAARLEGTICQVTQDDKGCVLILAFGLPPLGHEDDAFRAACAAGELDAVLGEVAPAHGVGVATGPAYCGGCGSRERRGYMLVGDAVNRASRLSQRRGGQVVCDEQTRNEVGERIGTRYLSPVGDTATDGPAYVLTAPSARELAPRPRGARTGEAATFVGRRRELAALQECVAAFANRIAATAAVLLTGPAGAGKTTIVANALGSIAPPCLVLSGSGSAIERSSTYHAWRSVIAALLRVDSLESVDERRDAVRTAVADAMGAEAWAPLLNGLLPFAIDENATTVQMSGQVRGQATLRLLVQLFQHAAASGPLILVLEDLHWFDTSSLELVRALHQSGAPVLQVAIVRSEADASDEVRSLCADLSADSRTLLLDLGPMVSEELRALLSLSLGGAAIPDDVLSLVVKRAEGNPFFSRELVLAMRESGTLVVEAKTCSLPPHASDQFELLLPNSVKSVLTQRLDRLDPVQLMTLKVSSVFGATFSEADIEAVHPLVAERPHVRSQLERLELLQFTRPSPLPSGGWSFAHALIRDATYELIPPSQRRRLHRAAALYLADGHNYALLAHHWRLAGDREQWLVHLEQAGHDAMRRGANHEAVAFFEDAIKLEDLVKDDALRRAQWSGQLGEAFYRLGSLAKSRRHLEEALRRLGKPLPRTATGWAMRGLYEAVSQCVLLGAPRRLVQARPHLEPRLHEASRLMNIVSEQCYFSIELRQMVVCLLSTINMAERTHAPEIASRAYGTLGYAVGLGRLHRLSRLYFDRGRRGLQADAHVNTAVGMALYHLAFGRWPECIAALEHGKARADAIDDGFGISLCLNVLGDARHLMGDLPDAARAYNALVTNARARSNAQHEVWGLSGGAETLLSQGRVEEASERVRECSAVLARALDRDRLAAVRHEGVKAAVLMRAGAPAAALTALAEALRLYQLGPTPMYATYWAISCMFETALALSHRQATGIAPEVVRAADRAMQRFAVVFPIGRTRRALLRGHERWIAGDRSSALVHWRRALSLGERFEMQHEIARARRVLEEPDAYGVPMGEASVGYVEPAGS